MYFGTFAEAGGLRRGPPVRLGPGDVEVGRALVNSSSTICRDPSSCVCETTEENRQRQVSMPAKLVERRCFISLFESVLL